MKDDAKVALAEKLRGTSGADIRSAFEFNMMSEMEGGWGTIDFVDSLFIERETHESGEPYETTLMSKMNFNEKSEKFVDIMRLSNAAMLINSNFHAETSYGTDTFNVIVWYAVSVNDDLGYSKIGIRIKGDRIGFDQTFHS